MLRIRQKIRIFSSWRPRHRIGSRFNNVKSVREKRPETDQVQITGSMNADPADFLDAENIQITIDGEYMLQPLVLTFPINEITFKAAKSNYAA